MELKGAKIEYANAYVSIKETNLLVKHIAQPIYMNLFICLSSDPCPPPGTLIMWLDYHVFLFIFCWVQYKAGKHIKVITYSMTFSGLQRSTSFMINHMYVTQLCKSLSSFQTKGSQRYADSDAELQFLKAGPSTSDSLSWITDLHILVPHCCHL